MPPTNSPGSATPDAERGLWGAIRGRAAYMAPEQVVRGVVDAATDQYGLAAILWELTIPVFTLGEPRRPGRG